MCSFVLDTCPFNLECFHKSDRSFVFVYTASSYRLSNVLPSAPDMSQLKLGVRSVAGKLSVMASGVVNTIQVRSIHCLKGLIILFDSFYFV